MYEDPELSDLIGRLREDTVRVVRAEVEVRRARFARTKAAATQGAIYGVAAALVAIVGLIGLEVGLILALSTIVGPLAATAIVVGATLLVAAVLGWIASGHFKRIGGKG